MIHDVDATLRALIERDVLNGHGVELSFDAPTKEWASKLSLPTINVFLYDIREDPSRRDVFFEEVRNEDGRVVERRQPPRRLCLAYLLSAWTKRAEDEHRLLSALLGCFLRADILPSDLLVGSLADVGRPVITQTAISSDGAEQFSEVWGALGGELRPSIHLAVIAPFDVSRSMPVGPPVTEVPRITVVRPDDVTPEVPRQGRGGRHGRRAEPASAEEAEQVPALPDEVVRAGAEDQPGRVFRVRDARTPMIAGTPMIDGFDVRAATLARLAALEDRVRAAVAGGQLADPATVDALRGLVVTDQQAMRIAHDGPSGPLATGSLGALDGSPLEKLAGRLDLDDVDLDLLMIAAAPDLDPRYEQLFGYLHDDVTQRRASIGLALRLTGLELTDVAARRRFASDSPLRRAGLIEIVDEARPFLTRPLRVPDRVAGALLGDVDGSTDAVRIVDEPLMDTTPWVGKLAASIGSGVSFVHIEDRPELTAVALAVSAVVLARGIAVVVELAEGRDPVPTVEAASREAMLSGGGLVIDPVNVLVDSGARTLNRLAVAPFPVVVVGRGRWRPEWAHHVPLALVAPPLDESERDACWRRALDGEFVDAAVVTSAFRLGPQRIERAAAAARLVARHRGSPLEVADIHAGARLQNAAGLQRLARRIEPTAGWSDLVVTPSVSAALRELTARVRHRALVLDGWKLRRGGGRGDGLTAMFSGPSGTGKTLAAGVIARELGVDLHTVDLATVVDKYIGETEKNLDRIFDEAEQVNTVLFFDEADALFGKRSEVRDARDRYANVEVAYLLQRMERFDGLAILATNLRLNIDDAFARRLDVTVDFPKPKAAERLRLWVHLIGRHLPLDDTVDLPFLAESFDITGGSIRNVVVTAAYLAAEAGRAATMTDFVRGVAREYKVGLLCLEHEFGPWYHCVDSAASVEAAGAADGRAGSPVLNDAARSRRMILRPSKRLAPPTDEPGLQF